LIVAWTLVLRNIELPEGQPLPMRERLQATLKAFWAMLMPVIIIGGMKSGVFTPTEAARGGGVLCPGGGLVGSPRNEGRRGLTGCWSGLPRPLPS